jgi:alanine racemase
MNQPTVTINHQNLAHNVDRLSRLVAPAEVMLAVKTNAYGHGLVEVAATGLKSGATALAVLEVSAGVTLRENGVTAPVFAWLLGEDGDYQLASKHNIELGISTIRELDAAANAAKVSGGNDPIVVHLKIDTGLTRNGSTAELWPSLCYRAAELQSRGEMEVRGVWSHLADASPEDDAEALVRFQRALDQAREAGLTPSVAHLGASSAGLRFPESRQSYVRFGIAAYGISPFEEKTAADLAVRPVMTVTAPVINADEDGLILAAGYLHGVLVGEHSDRHVIIEGQPWHVVCVDADSMRVQRQNPDSRELSSFVGAAAIIFGEGGPSAELLGSWCDTIGDEVVTSVSNKLPRVHVNAMLS